MDETSQLQQVTTELRRLRRQMEHPRHAAAREIAERLVLEAVAAQPDDPLQDALAGALRQEPHAGLRRLLKMTTKEITSTLDYSESAETGYLDDLVEQIALLLYRASDEAPAIELFGLAEQMRHPN